MAFRTAAFLLLAAHGVSGAGHGRNQDVQELGHLHASEAHVASVAHAETGGLHRLQEPIMFEWHKMRTGAFVLGKLEVPLLTALVEKYAQEPAPSPHEPTEDGGPSPVLQIWGIVSQALFMMIFAYVYVVYRRVPEGKYESLAAEDCDGNWRHSCWTCYEEPCTACFAMCCMPVRWAETIGFLKGALSFWAAFALMMFLWLFRAFQPLVVLMYLLFLVVAVKYRQDMRRRFNFDSQGGCSLCTDILMYMCCVCCAVVQEARHVEDALAREHDETECPLDRTRSNVRAECCTRRLFSAEGPYYRPEGSSIMFTEQA